MARIQCLIVAAVCACSVACADDLDGDGCVHQQDLGILPAHWGQGCP
ncbi:MAG TPA: hypothetical protein VM243_13095 [Phycisphaerae bacterium]|nr:hypothetical protein [Phycisphaerae bacterium]